MGYCRWAIVSNLRSFEVTTDGSQPAIFANARCSAQSNQAYGWVGQNDIEIVFGAYTNYCLFNDEIIQSATLIECDFPRYNCVNGQCVESPTGQYLSLAECQANCSPPNNTTWDCINGKVYASTIFGTPGKYSTKEAAELYCGIENCEGAEGFVLFPENCLLEIKERLESVRTSLE